MTRVRLPAEARIFLFATASRPVLGTTEPPIRWVKRPRREADHLPPSNAEFKERAYVFMAQRKVKYRGNFIPIN